MQKSDNLMGWGGGGGGGGGGGHDTFHGGSQV